jgi:hypothetical protein
MGLDLEKTGSSAEGGGAGAPDEKTSGSPPPEGGVCVSRMAMPDGLTGETLGKAVQIIEAWDFADRSYVELVLALYPILRSSAESLCDASTARV